MVAIFPCLIVISIKCGGVKLVLWAQVNVLLILNKDKKPKGQLRMDNPETLATLGVQDEDKQNTHKNTIQHRKLKR